MVALQRYVYILISKTYEYDLFGKWIFTDIIKHLKMKSFWVTGWALTPTTRVLLRDTQETEEEAAM